MLITSFVVGSGADFRLWLLVFFSCRLAQAALKAGKLLGVIWQVVKGFASGATPLHNATSLYLIVD